MIQNTNTHWHTLFNLLFSLYCSLSVHPFLCGRRREELCHWLEKDDDHAVNLGVHDHKPQHSTLVTSSKHALRISSHIEGLERVLYIEYFLCLSPSSAPFFFLCGTWYLVILPPFFFLYSVNWRYSLSNLSPVSYWTFFLRLYMN